MILINEFNTLQGRHSYTKMDARDLMNLLFRKELEWQSVQAIENYLRQNKIETLKSSALLLEVETEGEERFNIFLSSKTNKNNSSSLIVQRVTKVI